MRSICSIIFSGTCRGHEGHGRTYEQNLLNSHGVPTFSLSWLTRLGSLL
ncbi:hypothetical protein MA3A0930S_4728 [Mycobacteroides abscessus 3A-0930-S]|nr:hypothetical protein MA3A0119R_4780 [Mycobacteroides abscessus 3A-0119-R]EIV23980.1 hypothetical protein MA3A0122R_4879 [Mycobacteroides abscessus 3A-0122-R]EIV31696.1 hypothetical protein MA3A0122S_4633 [Mycobacteroides abscessus 3A-0122-S]EIV35475.1 hypothetical protein MA3A0731_4870 [Mycobacteroides abscessus 3A-0731]EIV44023.1 hypothetical protein MA3A0930R_4792 [Mycobacteroides abscessus 3A-0930-R]EIV46103.1 hypothetical protein MA3A0930S_4728 [Mycobacteroides abscessus 3A-0930-S]EIV7